MNINFNLKLKLTWRDIAKRAAFIIVTVALVVWALPRSNNPRLSFERGAVWQRNDLRAAFSFKVFKSEEAIAAEEAEAMQDFEPFYSYDSSKGDAMMRLFRKDLDRRLDSLPTIANAYMLSYRIASQLGLLYANGIVDTKEPLQVAGDTLRALRRVDGRSLTSISARRVLTPIEAYKRLWDDPMLKPQQNALQRLSLMDYIEPNLTYDSVRSNAEQTELLATVAQLKEEVQQGQTVIAQGAPVDDDAYQRLCAYQSELSKRHADSHEGMTTVGQIIYVFIIMLAFTIYLSVYRSDYFDRLRPAGMLYTLVIGFSLIASLMVSHGWLHVYLLPFAIAPIFIRVFMDSRTAFMALVSIVLICACMLQRPYEFIAVELAAGITAIFSLRELSSRSQLFWTAIVTTLVAIVMHLAVYMIRQRDMSDIYLHDLVYLAVSGLIVFCSYPLLYVIEKTFGFTSDITLIELSDTNKDLLRRMSEVAPGTFQHSIQVGNLSAEIARKIGGNAQLVRTGALYHDIGKIQNPIYFTENQSGGISPHEHLSYIESAQMIISHVTEGLKLADKYHLPQQICDLIATHHGLGKAKYFFIKYKNEHPDEPVDDLLFTYPGPNPFTKEQAILMMADAVEAASRSLPDYTEQSIRQLVDRIIDSMVSDGFFRECPITFRDIQYAKTVLIEKLKTIYHTRISYPEMKK